MNCGRVALDDVDVLVDRVGGAEVPHRLGDALARGQDVEALVALGPEEVPAALQVADQAVRLVLRGDRDAADAGIERVRQREVDDARLAAEIDRRLGAPVGQLHAAGCRARRRAHRPWRGGDRGGAQRRRFGVLAHHRRSSARRLRRRQADFSAGSNSRNKVASGGSVSAAEAGKPCAGCASAHDAAEIAHVRAAVEAGVGIENLAPAARRTAGRCDSRGAAPA